MERQPQKIRLELSAQAEKYARRDAPRDVRLMAARGALPLQPTELATVLFALMHDEDAEVKSTARDSLEGLPDGVISAVLGAPAHPALLDHLAHAFAENEPRLERIALNPATADRTVAFLASRPFRSVVEIAANNQQRLARCPAILDALEGPVAITECSSATGGCGLESYCRVGSAWQRINHSIRRALEGVSLADLQARRDHLPNLRADLRAAAAAR